MVTLKQIAERCGVTVATVSKSLNLAPDIGAETANRVRQTAREMGYYPNVFARGLRTNRSYNIGILFVDSTHSGLTHDYFSMVLESLKVEAEQLGYDITFISSNIGRSSMSYLEHCHYRRCDGVVIASVNFSDPMVAELVNGNIPVVTIDHVFENHSAVLSDNVQSMRDLVRYVHNKGHRKIAFIHGEDTFVTQCRLSSFYQTCNELGISVPDEYVIPSLYHDPKECEAATRKLLDLPNQPTCILFPDDFSYIGGLNEIERSGLTIPDDLSVAGYDGILLSTILRPKLTTLRQNTKRLGSEAARLLAKAIEYPKTFVPECVVVPGTVLEGDTVRQIG